MKIASPANARSRRTREALLGAAQAVLETEGFGALTMGEVARRAGVSRGAAYLHFSSRSELVASLFDHIAGQAGLAESLRSVWDAPDGLAALHEWAAHLARYHPKLIAVDRAVTQVQAQDADAAEHRLRVSAGQRAGCSRLASWLADEGRLAEPWTVSTATDMLYALISTDMVERLVVDCGWNESQFADRFAAVLQATFTR